MTFSFWILNCHGPAMPLWFVLIMVTKWVASLQWVLECIKLFVSKLEIILHSVFPITTFNRWSAAAPTIVRPSNVVGHRSTMVLFCALGVGPAIHRAALLPLLLTIFSHCIPDEKQDINFQRVTGCTLYTLSWKYSSYPSIQCYIALGRPFKSFASGIRD